MKQKVAALYVARGGVYWCRDDIDSWDIERDAKLYDGPWPVVAHPPCARWCRLAKFVASRGGGAVGDDGGTFAAALASVRRWGGVLEHPAWSMAWAAHGLTAPPARGWHRDTDGGWACEVSQAAYGHRARKLTWLYYCGETPPPAVDWSRPTVTAGVVTGLRANCGRAVSERVRQKEASATPPAFAELLLRIARGCR